MSSAAVGPLATSSTTASAGQERPSRWRGPLVVFVAALALRLIYLLEFSRSVFFQSPILDAAWHDQWARRIAAGHLLDGAPYFRAPLYPWFLALVYRLFGTGPWAIRLLQELLGAAAAAGLALLVARRLGRTPGLVAGLILAAYGPFIFFSGELLIEGALFLPLLAVVTALLLRAEASLDAEEAPLFPWFTGGLALGVAALARPNALALVPAALILPWVRGAGEQARDRFRRIALPLVVGVVLPILPVTLINFIASGDLVGIASQGGINFYAGNNAAADGRSVVVPELGNDVSWEEFVPRTTRVAEDAERKTLKPSQVSAWWSGRAWHWIRSRPGDAAALLGRKALVLVSGFEAPNNRDLYVARRESLLLGLTVGRLGPLLYPWGLLLPLAVLGVAGASSEERRRLLPFLGLAAAYGLSLLPFFICDRFRLPLIFWLAPPAALGLLRLPALVRAGRRAALPIGVGLVALVAANLPWGGDTSGTSADAWHKLGEALYNRQNYVGALSAFNAAVQRAPGDNLPRLARAFTLQALKQDSLAGAEFERLADRLPDSWQAQHGYGRWLLDHGRAGQAVPFLEKAAGQAPERGELHRDLGFAYENVGNDAAAGVALNRALQLGQESAAVHLSLGLAALRRGSPPLAEKNWERGLELDPNDFRTLYNLGLLRLGQGRDGDAAELWRRASAVDPASPLVPYQLARLALRRGQVELARATLIRALDMGLPRAEVERDPQLGPLLPSP